MGEWGSACSSWCGWCGACTSGPRMVPCPGRCGREVPVDSQGDYGLCQACMYEKYPEPPSPEAKP